VKNIVKTGVLLMVGLAVVMLTGCESVPNQYISGQSLGNESLAKVMVAHGEPTDGQVVILDVDGVSVKRPNGYVYMAPGDHVLNVHFLKQFNDSVWYMDNGITRARVLDNGSKPGILGRLYGKNVELHGYVDRDKKIRAHLDAGKTYVVDSTNTFKEIANSTAAITGEREYLTATVTTIKKRFKVAGDWDAYVREYREGD